MADPREPRRDPDVRPSQQTTVQREPGTASWKDVPNEAPNRGQNTSPPRDKSEFIRGEDEFVPGEPTFPMETADEPMSSLPREDPQLRTLEENERTRQTAWEDTRRIEDQEREARERRMDYTKDRVALEGPYDKPLLSGPDAEADARSASKRRE